VPQSWQSNHWYRLEVSWGATGNIVGRLYDSDGTTLLNTVTATDTTVSTGGIAFRGLGENVYFDTMQLSGLALGGGDYYGVSVNAGDSLLISTATPADGPNEFVNTLDPKIELYDPSGTLVASNDNSAPDGRNALLTYIPSITGCYIVRVLGAMGTVGEYALNVASSTSPASAVPSIPDLVAASDTGISDEDNLTNRNNSLSSKTLQSTFLFYSENLALSCDGASGRSTGAETGGRFLTDIRTRRRCSVQPVEFRIVDTRLEEAYSPPRI